MYTLNDALKYLFDPLNKPELTGNISGLLCESDSRPPGPNEDITIGVLSLTDNSGVNNAQLCDLNINIYAHDKRQEFANQYANTPNRERLDEILAVVILLLNGNSGISWANGRLHIINIFGPLKRPENAEHFYNVRVRMKLYSNN